jgi:hypothetical protein
MLTLDTRPLRWQLGTASVARIRAREAQILQNPKNGDTVALERHVYHDVVEALPSLTAPLASNGRLIRNQGCSKAEF